MKRVRTALVVLIVLGVGGMLLYSYDLLIVEPEEYIKPEVETVTEFVEVNPRDSKIEAREKELAEKYERIKSLEARLDVLIEERDLLVEEITKTQEELASFMTSSTSRN